uniref:TctD-like protein n=1 Tax=Liagora brachyclada TaxID=1884665 RepID=A0A1G4P066_9FLOR|nr:Hypothetical protein ycf29 [Liagora brachyclada]SCW24295.1 Hypothetical protein ycf29 [Liagora brachyclada]
MSNRILLVDDDISLLASLSSYLSEAGFCVETVNTVENAIHSLNNHVYDLVVSDIVLPKRNGYNLIQYIHDNVCLQNVPVIFLTAKGMTNDRIVGYDLGCAGYLVKPFDPAELLSMIRNVLFNRKNNNVTYKPQVFNVDLLAMLTPREQDVLYRVLKGMTNKEIAASLGLTVRNIEKYVSRLLSKTDTRNRTELAQHFYRNRYVNNNIKGE